MSFHSDKSALEALCAAIFKRGFVIDVVAGDLVLGRSFSTAPPVVWAVGDVSEPVRLVIRSQASGRRAGAFLVLCQDDPDCLIVDHTLNDTMSDIWADWSKAGGI